MDRVALARHIIDFGLTEADLTLGRHERVGGAESEALLQTAPGSQMLIQTQTDLHDVFPAGLSPQPGLLNLAAESGAALPRADYLVVTWTVSELAALVDVFTPGIQMSKRARTAATGFAHTMPFRDCEM